MQVMVNGRQRAIDAPATVADLLDSLGLDPRRVAVECNKLLVRRARLDQAALADGDVLEIVTLVGGGYIHWFLSAL